MWVVIAVIAAGFLGYVLIKFFGDVEESTKKLNGQTASNKYSDFVTQFREVVFTTESRVYDMTGKIFVTEERGSERAYRFIYVGDQMTIRSIHKHTRKELASEYRINDFSLLQPNKYFRVSKLAVTQLAGYAPNEEAQDISSKFFSNSVKTALAEIQSSSVIQEVDIVQFYLACAYINSLRTQDENLLSATDFNLVPQNEFSFNETYKIEFRIVNTQNLGFEVMPRDEFNVLSKIDSTKVYEKLQRGLFLNYLAMPSIVDTKTYSLNENQTRYLKSSRAITVIAGTFDLLALKEDRAQYRSDMLEYTQLFMPLFEALAKQKKIAGLDGFSLLVSRSKSA